MSKLTRFVGHLPHRQSLHVDNESLIGDGVFGLQRILPHLRKTLFGHVGNVAQIIAFTDRLQNSLPVSLAKRHDPHCSRIKLK